MNDFVYFTSKHAGHLYIKADCVFLTKTYAIEDCLDYQPMTSNVHQSRWSIPSAVTSASIFGYSSDGWKFGNASSFSTISYNTNITRPFSMEFTVTDSTGNQPIFGAYFGSSYIMVNRSSNNQQLIININGTTTSYTISFTLPYTVRFELTDNTVSVYINDSLIGTQNHSISGNSVPSLQTGSSRYNVMKDFKIKPL